MNKSAVLLFAILWLVGCSSPEYSANRSDELEQADALLDKVEKNAVAQGVRPLFGIDHSRLAEKIGEVLDASRVEFFSSPEINSQILKEQIRAGLDLPYRVQAYAENGEVKLRYTDADFLEVRHGLADSQALRLLRTQIDRLVAGLPEASPVARQVPGRNYGIVELDSDYAFDETVDRLKSTILAEDDTTWFQDIDFQQQAEAFDIVLPRSKLLVFGAPGPGASAMREYPSIGLDAFGQKVLVYEQGSAVKVIFNDIPAFAELHYGDDAIIHKVIGFRLKGTLSSSIEH